MSILHDARNLTASATVAMLLIALRAVLVLKMVGPTTIGIWKSVMMLYFVSEFIRLGVPHGVALKIPLLIGRHQRGEADERAAAAGTAVLLLGLLAGLVVCCSSFFVEDAQYRLALRFVSVVVCLSLPHVFLRELAGARHNFRAQAGETLIDSSTNFVFTLVLASWFGLAGLGAAAILSVLIPVCFLSWRLRFGFPLKFDPRRVKGLISAGLPYSLLEASFHLMRYLGVLAVALILGPTYVGYFALSMLIMDFGANIAETGISRVVMPHLLREFGRMGSLQQVTDYFRLPIRFSCYTLPPMLGLGVLLVPSLVSSFLPQYTAGIQAAQVTLWGIFFLAVHSATCSFISAAGKVNQLLKMLVVLAPPAVLIPYWVASAGFGLAGVAWVSLSTLAVATSLELYVAERAAGRGRMQVLVFLASMYFPLIAAIVLTSVVQSLTLAVAFPALVGLSSKLLLYLVLYAPLFTVYETRFCLIRTVRQAM